jgi:hypothetical protein
MTVQKSDLIQIPGIGKTFVKDFARIDVHCVSDLQHRDAGELYQLLCNANDAVDHKTSKNYLYVMRMAVYYANGGRDTSKLTWNAWKD